MSTGVQVQEAGAHSTGFRLEVAGAPALPPGVYLARITAGSGSRTLRVVVLE